MKSCTFILLLLLQAVPPLLGGNQVKEYFETKETHLLKDLLANSNGHAHEQSSNENGINGDNENDDNESSTEQQSSKDEHVQIEIVSSYVTNNLQSRIQKMFHHKIKSPECRAEVAEHFKKYIDAIANEEALPFSQTKFQNECPEDVPDFNTVSIASLMNRTYQPSLEEESLPLSTQSSSSLPLYIDKPGNLNLLYGILTHGEAGSTMRLIDVLYDTKNDANGEGNGNTLFVIHVDGKEESDEAYHTLLEYANDKDHVHILPKEFRVRVNWGGFSMVQATLNILKYSFALLPQESTLTPLPKSPLQFHKFIHLASSTYPIKSNTQIRRTIAEYPLDANLVQIAMKPIEPHPATWQYFVECDDAVHRIYRLHPLSHKAGNGVDLYMGSQWFIISNEFAYYLAKPEKGSMVQQFIEYAKHIIIADEGFFSTVLRHSRFCTKHHNSNFLHLQFDRIVVANLNQTCIPRCVHRWESDLEGIDRDERKCLMPDPDKCGRSPTVLTKDYLFALEMSNDLFARKFSNEEDSELKDILDVKRAQEEAKIRDIAAGNYTEQPSTVDTSFEGYGSLIVAKETIHDHNPLCLGLGSKGNKVKLVSCFHDQVLGTLANDWATGAVIEEEVLQNNQWEVGPCSSDGELKRSYETAEMTMIKGMYSPAGPHCMIKQLGGPRRGRCIDVEGERVEPGGQLQVYPCMNQWHQMFGFGNGEVARNSTIFGSVPRHIIHALSYKGKDQPPYLCFGVVGRGKTEYSPWKEDKNRQHFDTVDFVSNQAKKIRQRGGELHLPVRLWKNKQLVTVPCTDDSAVIDFLFVPFIVENFREDGDEGDSEIEVEEEEIKNEDKTRKVVSSGTSDEL